MLMTAADYREAPRAYWPGVLAHSAKWYRTDEPMRPPVGVGPRPQRKLGQPGLRRAASARCFC